MAASQTTCWGCQTGQANQLAHMDEGGCLHVAELEVKKKPARKTIYYCGIGAGRRQFFSEKSFYRMIANSRDLQAIIRKFGKVYSYTELSLKENCDIIGAAIM